MSHLARVILGCTLLVLVLLVVLSAAVSGVVDRETGVASPEPPPPTPITWEEARSQSRVVGYREWFRSWGAYQGTALYFRGQVKQVIDEGSTDQATFSSLRVDVLPTEYGQYLGRGIIYLHGLVAPRGVRILDDDLIEFVGIAEAPLTYQTTLGASITVPAMKMVALRWLPPPDRRGARTTGFVRSR